MVALGAKKKLTQARSQPLFGGLSWLMGAEKKVSDLIWSAGGEGRRRTRRSQQMGSSKTGEIICNSDN